MMQSYINFKIQFGLIILKLFTFLRIKKILFSCNALCTCTNCKTKKIIETSTTLNSESEKKTKETSECSRRYSKSKLIATPLFWNSIKLYIGI